MNTLSAMFCYTSLTQSLSVKSIYAHICAILYSNGLLYLASVRFKMLMFESILYIPLSNKIPKFEIITFHKKSNQTQIVGNRIASKKIPNLSFYLNLKMHKLISICIALMYQQRFVYLLCLINYYYQVYSNA